MIKSGYSVNNMALGQVGLDGLLSMDTASHRTEQSIFTRR